MGMKYLELFENFKEEDIHTKCRMHGIENYVINEDGTIDVYGDVNLSRHGLEELPLVFNIVTGEFDCSTNKLTSLKGAPKKVYKFDCQNNKLKTLEHAPIECPEYFDCCGNKLTSLIGCPKNVNQFYTQRNELTTLEYGPIKSNTYYCYNNKLTSLKGAPEIVEYFDCGENQLTTLEYAPKKVVNLYCYGNKLTSLEGCPTYIDNDFNCGENKFYNLEFFPEYIGGLLNLKRTPVYLIFSLFKNQQDFIDSLDYDYFRGGNKLNKIRLAQALEEFGLELPESITGYIYV